MNVSFDEAHLVNLNLTLWKETCETKIVRNSFGRVDSQLVHLSDELADCSETCQVIVYLFTRKMKEKHAQKHPV